MQRIIKYELFKILANKVFLIAAAVFLVFLVFIDTQNMNYSDSYGNLEEYYNEYYKGNEGTVTYDNFKKAEAELEKKPEKGTGENRIEIIRRNGYFNDVNSAWYNQLAYKDDVKNNKEFANAQLNKYGINSFEYRYAELHSKMIQNEQKTGVYFSIPSYNWLDLSLTSIMAAVLIMFINSSIFTREYSQNVDSLILTSKKGRYSVCAAKVISAVIISVITALLFLGAHTVTAYLLLGMADFNSPAKYCNFNLISTCFNFTCLEYFLISCAFTVFACVCVGLLTLLFSSIFKNQIVPFFLTVLVLGLPPMAALQPKKANVGELTKHILTNLSNFSFYNLIKTDDIFNNFKAYNVFGYPVLSCFVIPLFFLIITVIFVILTHRCFQNHQVN